MGHKREPAHAEWFTPPRYLEMVRKVFDRGIDLDPASSPAANRVVQARRFFTPLQDGLAQNWRCLTLFLNPPYGRRNGKSGPYNMPLWVAKLVEEFDAGNVEQAILLCNANTGTSWFRPLFRFPICFVRHRIHFIDSRTGSPQRDPMYDQAFVYLGPYGQRFARVFGEIGTVVRDVWVLSSPLRQGDAPVEQAA